MTELNRYFGRPRDERVMAADWTPQQGVKVSSSELPVEWLSALRRVGKDLHVRQYGGSVQRIDWVAEYDADSGCVLLFSDVSAVGCPPTGSAASGSAALVDDDEETVAVSIAGLVQDQVARSGVAWPWGQVGEFMSPRRGDAVGLWSAGGEEYVIGELR